MSSQNTPIQNNASRLFNQEAVIYTTDPTYAGYVVDIAVLQQDMNTITQPDAYIVNLDPVFLSYAGFKSMFYRNGINFNPSPNLDGTLHAQPYILNNFRKYSSTSSSCGIACDQSLSLDGSFNLLKTLLLAYETDLNISNDCWDRCTLMEFYDIINRIKGLTDIQGTCGLGIRCALSLNDFFDQLEMQGLQMSGEPWLLPLDPNNITATFGTKKSPSVYPGLVTAVITANFHSTTPGVKDVQVRWPFIINFTSVANKDINNLRMTSGPDSPSNAVDGIYPVFLTIDNNSDPITFRSDDLLFTTVDISSGVLYAKDASSNVFDGNIFNLPPYTRANADTYSFINYGL